MTTSHQDLFLVEVLEDSGWEPLTYQARPLKDAQDLFLYYHSKWSNRFYRLVQLQEVGQ